MPRNNPPANAKAYQIIWLVLFSRFGPRLSPRAPHLSCRNRIDAARGRANDVGVNRWWIETAALGIENLAVLIIVVATAHGTVKYLVHSRARVADAYQRYKIQLGKSLLLGLELLVAADVIRTVTLEPTMQNILMLAVLVVVRTFLSWSLVVEMEGHWPWMK